MLKIEDAKELVDYLKQHRYQDQAGTGQDVRSKLFFESEVIRKDELELPESIRRRQVLVEDDDQYYANVRVVPFHDQFFLTDSPRIASTKGQNDYHSNNEGLYGYVGGDGMKLSNFISSRLDQSGYEKGLDLCTGSGIIGLSLAKRFKQIFAVDIDEAAIPWAKLNQSVNHVDNFQAYLGDLYQPVADQAPFDVIIANPSYAFYSPEFSEFYKVREHEVAADYGLSLVFRILDGFESHLKEKGKGFICTLTPILNGQDYLLREIQKRYQNKNYSFEIVYNQKSLNPACASYYRGLGISRFYFVYLLVRKGEPFSIQKKLTKSYYLSHLPIQQYIPNSLRRLIKKILNEH